MFTALTHIHVHIFIARSLNLYKSTLYSIMLELDIALHLHNIKIHYISNVA